jgi:membrane peptidoglycan carboxypeptidase
MLEQVIQRGTGTAASLGSRPAFGKTGTTDDYSDAWFVGCTVQLCAATWVGHQRAPIPMPDVHGTAVFGGTFPAEIWRDFMLVAMRGRPRIAFPEPPPIPGAVLAPEPAPVELDGGESEGDGEGTGEGGQGEGHGEEGNGKGNGNEGNQGRGQGDGG